MQSVLQLMGEKEMYDYWSQTYRVHNLEWSQAKAADILDAWQKKFTEVKKNKTKKQLKLSEWPLEAEAVLTVCIRLQ